jgi:hypothetical protein
MPQTSGKGVGEGLMLRGLAGLTMLGTAAAVAAWVTVGGFGPGVTEAMVAGESIAAKTSYTLASAPAEDEASVPAPVAAAIPDAAIVDASLLSPYPMVAAVRAPEPIAQADTLVTASLRPAVEAADRPATAVPAAAPPSAAARKPIVVPRLERDGTLSLTQIAQIKAALNLSPDQEQYWKPVEAELRSIVRQLAAQKASGRKPTLALDANEAQRLYLAAGPLIMSLREDQKREARRLARAMGLEQVASLI